MTAAALLLAAGCGSAEPTARATESPSATAAPGAIAADGDWLLRFTTEGGAEGELTGAVYVSYNPTTGRATARRMPSVPNPDTYPDAVAVLVSGDQKLALLDAGIPPADARRGRLTVYSTTTNDHRVVNVSALTGRSGLRLVGAAFAPDEDEVLRVVDTARRVWKVDLLARTATRDGDLPRHPGWIFANGFDKNTGLPYIEDTDSEATLPTGNGIGDVRAVQRRGGEIRIDDGTDKVGEPALPCGFSGGFVAADRTVWIFCADTAQITTFRLTDGAGSWEAFGKASKAIVPASAADVPVVLPPVQ